MDAFSIVFSQILTGIYRGSIYWLIAVGLTLIFGVMRVVNFAQATLLVLGGYISFSLYLITGSWLAALLTTPLIVGALGVVVERGLLKPIYKIETTYQLLMTFALVLILNDAVKLLWGKQPVSMPLPDLLKGGIVVADIRISYYVIFVIVIGVAIFITLLYILGRTLWGLSVRAVWRRREFAEILGINTDKIYTTVFFVGSLLSGLGGAIIVMFTPMIPGLGDYLIVIAFIVTVIAGLGNLTGAYISSLIIGIIESLSTYFLPEFDILVIYLIMAVVLLIRPQGIFGER